MIWSTALKKHLKENVPLSKFTTFRIGGKARFFIQPKNIRHLLSVLKQAHNLKVPYYILGNGSNVLVSDEGVDALVIRLSAPSFKKITFRKNIVEAGSGAHLRSLIEQAKNKGLGGCEFLSGIPATLGGALVMNAGIKTASIAELVEEVRVIDRKNRLRILRNRQLKFAYRKSNLSNYVILSVKLKLTEKPKEEITYLINSFLKKRMLSQEPVWYNAGCVFKNPPRHSAGRLIDLCGLKGKRIGDAQVSYKHANFIINRAHATAKDVLALMDLVRNRVKDQFGINLEPEIKIW
ncbi:MAG: UDP-N-acetylmuramate dehydrogenase [Candidatus Omnitrophica bacterium]|nr:UDP-N-acetylmuramate dehydrogenase [Candidatus Omnitrophota bacterium]